MLPAKGRASAMEWCQEPAPHLEWRHAWYRCAAVLALYDAHVRLRGEFPVPSVPVRCFTLTGARKVVCARLAASERVRPDDLAAFLAAAPVNVAELNMAVNWYDPSYLTEAAAAVVLPHLAPPHHDMRRLLLSGNSLRAGAPAFAAVCQGIVALRLALVVLDMEHTGLRLPHCQQLAGVVAQLAALRVLRLGNNEINAAAMAVLAPALGALAQLRVLRLRFNRFQRSGCEALAAALPRHPRLRAVDVADCGLRDGDVALLRAAMQRPDGAVCSETVSSDLGANQSGYDGVGSGYDGAPFFH
jgi:hypothetical protein